MFVYKLVQPENDFLSKKVMANVAIFISFVDRTHFAPKLKTVLPRTISIFINFIHYLGARPNFAGCLSIHARNF